MARIRETAGKTWTETAYYLLNTALSGERLPNVVREHWSVENRLRWRPDVVMNENQAWARLGNGPHNMVVLRHVAINVMQKNGAKTPFAARPRKPAGTTPTSPAS